MAATNKVLLVGTITRTNKITEKLTVITLALLAAKEGEQPKTQEVKLFGNALKALQHNELGEGMEVAAYCEEKVEEYEKDGEQKEKTVYLASSLWSPVNAVSFPEGFQFLAGRLTTPKPISAKLTVVSLASGKNENVTFKELKFVGDALAAFNENGIDKGNFIGLIVTETEEKFTRRDGGDGSKVVYFAKTIFAPFDTPRENEE